MEEYEVKSFVKVDIAFYSVCTQVRKVFSHADIGCILLTLSIYVIPPAH